MVKSCVAYGCTNRWKKDCKEIRFHRFPFSRKDILNKWIQAVRRNNWKPTKESFLCSQHFAKDSYEMKLGAGYNILKPDAVPCIFDYPTHLLKPVRKRVLQRNLFSLERKVTNSALDEKQEKMDTEVETSDSAVKRGRGRPRKTLTHSANMARFSYSEQSIDLSLKRKNISELQVQNVQDLLSDDDDIPLNKKFKSDQQPSKTEFVIQPTRLQPHRAARYTESYSGTSSPDVVVLSDDDKQNGQCNGYDSDSDGELPLLPVPKELSEEEWHNREIKIQTLRRDLCNEEMKLVLLKKLQQSQIVKESQDPAITAAPSPLLPSSSKVPSSVSRDSTISVSSLLPNKQLSSNNKHQIHHRPYLGVRTQEIHTKDNSINPSQHQHAKVMKPNSGSRVPPPNVVVGYPVQSVHAVKQHNSVPAQHQTTTQNQVSSSSCPVSSQHERVDIQTPAQRQAAAKLALRKQLEKTLLQIPPPKPPPPELHFLPNANNPEFICLLGLEIVVDFITNTEKPFRILQEPFSCTQCSNDFTPVWKWRAKERSDKKRTRAICEMCVTSNIKKSLKAEHTNRLKTAFVKALQQEQEIEQRLAQTASSATSMTLPPTYTSGSLTISGISSSTSSPPSSHHISCSPRIGTTTTNVCLNNSGALLQQFPKLTSQHQSLLQVQTQQLLNQGLPQPAHMLSFSPILAQYPYQMLGKSSILQADLQRQYLLDMIPSRSVPQSSVNWKT